MKRQEGIIASLAGGLLALSAIAFVGTHGPNNYAALAYALGSLGIFFGIRGWAQAGPGGD